VHSLIDAVGLRRGHFVYESGHHGDLWLELDAAFADPARTRAWVRALAPRVARADVVCGPMVGGALLAQALAEELGAGFAFATREVVDDRPRYRVTSRHAGRRVLVVDDAINAGSAVSATIAELVAGGATIAGVAALITLGDAADRLASAHGVEAVRLLELERTMWTPDACPSCVT
jgi:orotate phosphoribosyltransferase